MAKTKVIKANAAEVHGPRAIPAYKSWEVWVAGGNGGSSWECADVCKTLAQARHGAALHNSCHVRIIEINLPAIP